ncbi:MAG: hypothetical protein ACI4DO_04765 [Roseburia sp.]
MRNISEQDIQTILNKYAEMHPCYFLQHKGLFANFYDDYLTKMVFLCVFDMYRRKRIWNYNASTIAVNTVVTNNYFDNCIIELFTKLLSPSQVENNISYFLINHIIERLYDGNVLKEIEQKAIEIKNFVHKNKTYKIDAKDESTINVFIRRVLNIKQAYLLDYLQRMKDDKEIDMMDIFIFVYMSNCCMYNKKANNNPQLKIICDRCSLIYLL